MRKPLLCTGIDDKAMPFQVQVSINRIEMEFIFSSIFTVVIAFPHNDLLSFYTSALPCSIGHLHFSSTGPDHEIGVPCDSAVILSVKSCWSLTLSVILGTSSLSLSLRVIKETLLIALVRGM